MKTTLVLLLLLGFVDSTRSATFAVTTPADSGPGSLRQAILDANAASGADVIVFTIGGTITLTSGLPALSDETTIQGPGTNLLTVSGNNAMRVFTVNTQTSVTISGLTIANGKAVKDANGAGIANAGTLTIQDCALVNNQAFGGWGGGIFNSGTLAITNSTFSDNEAVGEAGSGSGGTTDGAGGGGAGMGGGLFSMMGTVTLVGCSFVDNRAMGGDGGGTNGWRNGNGGGINGGQGAVVLEGNGQPGGFGGGGGGGGGDHGLGGGGGVGGAGGFGGGGGGGGQGSRLGGGGGGSAGFGSGAGDDGDFFATGSGGGGAGLGGGVFVESGTVTIIDCVFIGNQTIGGLGGFGQSGYGGVGSGVIGGVFILGGTVNVQNSVVNLVNAAAPLETWSYGSAQSLAPVGTPKIFVNGGLVLNQATERGPVEVSLQTSFPGGTICYSLDDLDLRSTSTFYTRPFAVSTSVLLRAVAHNANVSAAVEMDPIRITILPVLKPSTAGGGTVGVGPPVGSYFSNSVASIRAQPASGWTFLQWLGDAGGTNASATVTMSRDKYVQAVFGTTIGITTIGGGSIAPDPASPVYPFGSAIRLSAQPQIGNYFVRWDVGGLVTNNPFTFVVSNANPTVTAVFAALGSNQAALTVIENGRGHVVNSLPAGVYESGKTVTLVATPDAGQDFLGWRGDASGTQNPLVAIMDQSRVIQANFTRRPTLSTPPGLTGLTPDGFRLFVTGEMGAVYQILGSTSFTNWLPLSVVTNPYGMVQFTDGTATNRAFGFYRAQAH